jgi:hypothetical protein
MENIVYSKNDIFIADCGCAADAKQTPRKNATNAAFIVRACNSHYDLLAALELCTRYLSDLNGSDWIPGNNPGCVDMRQRAINIQKLAFSKCAKAKG